MSFTFGGFDSGSLELIATLRGLPSLGGLQLETLEAPGTDGLAFGGTTRTAARFVFDVIVQGVSVADAIGKADAVAAGVDPARGPQALAMDAVPGWQWSAVLAVPIEWRRLTWDAGAGYQLRADLTFDALEAYGRPLVDDEWEYSAAGSWVLTRAKGNARSFPTVELRGVLSASESVTVTVGGVTVEVGGPLTASQTLRLDWDSFEFARWAGAVKVDSVVRRMSTLDRPELWPNQASTFVVTTTGTISLARLRANSRRQ